MASSLASLPADHQTHQPAATLDRLQALVADDLGRVNGVIIEKVRHEVRLISDLATYIVSSGGKRLRPALTLACARLCGYEGERHVHLAACVEFIHTATLLHDDVVDESAVRRGQPTANTVWSNQSSVLVGDFLFSRAFQLMVSDGSLPVLKLLSDTAATISQGEVQQLMTAHSPQTEQAAYLEVITAKTAALFAAAAQIGALVSGKTEYEAPLRAFGLNLGIAFQLVDDALDYSASEQSLGKSIGDDFREGKITLPVIVAYRNGNAQERAFFVRTLQDQHYQESDLEEAMQIIARHGGLERTLQLAQDYAQRARSELHKLPSGQVRDIIEDTVNFCVARTY